MTLQDISQVATRELFAQLKALQEYLRKPESEKNVDQVAAVTLKLRAVKAELTKRDAFKPKTGTPSVGSGESHGVATLQQKEPPPLEELKAELELLQAQEDPQNDDRIAILKRAIAARTK